MILFCRNLLAVLMVLFWGFCGARHKIKWLNWSYIIGSLLVLPLEILLVASDIPGASSFILWVCIDMWMIWCGVRGLKH